MEKIRFNIATAATYDSIWIDAGYFTLEVRKPEKRKIPEVLMFWNYDNVKHWNFGTNYMVELLESREFTDLEKELVYDVFGEKINDTHELVRFVDGLPVKPEQEV